MNLNGVLISVPVWMLRVYNYTSGNYMVAHILKSSLAFYFIIMLQMLTVYKIERHALGLCTYVFLIKNAYLRIIYIVLICT